MTTNHVVIGNIFIKTTRKKPFWFAMPEQQEASRKSKGLLLPNYPSRDDAAVRMSQAHQVTKRDKQAVYEHVTRRKAEHGVEGLTLIDSYHLPVSRVMQRKVS